jgi:hypothetical protein
MKLKYFRITASSSNCVHEEIESRLILRMPAWEEKGTQHLGRKTSSPLGRPRRGWKGNIKIDIMKWVGMVWIVFMWLVIRISGGLL